MKEEETLDSITQNQQEQSNMYHGEIDLSRPKIK